MTVRTSMQWLFGTLIVLSSCAPSKQSSSTKGYLKSSSPQNNPSANNAFGTATNNTVVDKSQFLTFSRELQMRLNAYNIDTRKVQFYIDQKLTLSRIMDSTKAEVAAGTVRFINGKKTDEIIIPAYTPGIVESIDANGGIRVSFEAGNSFLFVPADNDDRYVIAGNNWDNGTVEVPYEKGIYRASSGANASVSDMKLVVKAADVNKNDKKTRTLTGRKLGL